MLLEELIEKAFCDGYEYAQKLFFLSPDGHAFKGEDIIKKRQEMNLRNPEIPKKFRTELAYTNAASSIDQSKAWEQAGRDLRRKGVEGEHYWNARQNAVDKAYERGHKELNRRFNAQRERKLAKASSNGFFKKLLKRIK
jgi:hypothetical protein